MNLRTFFKIITLSFYSPSLYINIAKKWQHWGLGFLIRFSILVSLMASLSLFAFISMIDFRGEMITAFINTIPELNINQSKANFVDQNLKSPIYLGSTQNLFVIDLDAKTAEKYPEYLITFTAYGVTLNLLETSPINLSYNEIIGKNDTKLINSESLTTLLIKNQKKFLLMIIVLGIPFGSLIYFIITLLKAGFYSSIASICTNIFSFNMTFKQLTRLAIIANAPAFIISNIIVLLLFSSNLNLSQFIATSIYLFYFLGGTISFIKSNRS